MEKTTKAMRIVFLCLLIIVTLSCLTLAQAEQGPSEFIIKNNELNFISFCLTFYLPCK